MNGNNGNDEELRSKVEEALAPLAFRPINVTVDNGVVYLDGTVRAGAERVMAVRLVERVKGVRKVVSKLDIGEIASLDLEKMGQPYEEASLEKLRMDATVEPALMDDIGTTDVMESASENEPFFPPTDPVIHTVPRERQGIEVLGGFAPTADEQFESPDHPPKIYHSDDELAEDVRQALLRDASTTNLNIRVLVRSRIVYLRGTVQSFEDADQAEAIAANVPGIVEVREELTY